MQNRRNAIWLLIDVLFPLGLFTGRPVFFNLAYVFLGLMLLSLLWSWLAVRRVHIGRRTRSRRSQVGRNFVEQFSIRNAFFLPKLWLEVRDHSDLPGHRASHVVPSLMPRKTYTWRVDTLCIVRGEFQLGPMTIISGDPFGLFLTPRQINAVERMIVYPAVVPVSQFRLPIGLISGGDPQRHISHNMTTNAAGVREYIQGDSIKRINWKSTARHNKLIVKEFEIDPLVDIWMFVDFSMQSLIEEPSVQRQGGTGVVIPNGGGIPASTEEYSVVVAASLATHFIEIERALGFVAYTPNRELLQPERGHRQLTRILENLAVARSQSRLSLKEMISLETPHLARGATLVIITSSLDTGWISELNVLARRGIRPMCIYVDPSSFGPGNSDEVRGRLNLMRIPTLVIRKGDNLAAALTQRPM
jgi:uncharacterized protein (DUF58 family)